jgi:integrase
MGLTKRPRPHDRRHTNASWLIQGGVALPMIQRHLSHQNIQTKVDRYGHPDGKTTRVVADVVGNTLTPVKANSKQKNPASVGLLLLASAHCCILT